MAQTFVIKLGGSNISKSKDDLFDFAYISEFKNSLQSAISRGDKFFVCLGGGFAARMYRDLAKDAGITEVEQLHWIGTTVNVLNAIVAKATFGEGTDEEVYKFEDYYSDKTLEIKNSVKFGGGGRPGHSGDYDAFMAAKKLGAKVVYSLKNVNGIYSSDPKLDPSAKRMEKLTWDEYFKIIGHKEDFEPGGNYPIDPVTSKMAKEAGMKFIILLGSDLENFNSALKGAPFTGTIVTD
jgi:uridylate kinase